MISSRKIAAFIATGLADVDERSDILEAMTREQMIAYRDRRLADIRASALELALDRAAVEGTTVDYELRVLRRAIDDVEAYPAASHRSRVVPGEIHLGPASTCRKCGPPASEADVSGSPTMHNRER